MGNQFENFACWTPQFAGQAGFHSLGPRNVVGDAMVQATKVDIPITPQGGSEILSINQLIESFISSFENDETNTIYAITGDSGSGKTFLVRCAQTIVEKDPRAHVVYVPRDVTSLYGILKLILRGLPGELAEQALREVEASNVEELNSELILQLVRTRIMVAIAQGNGREELLADGTLNDEELLAVNELYGRIDDSGIYRLGLSEYLAQPDVISHLIRPGGVLSNHVLAMRGKEIDGDLVSIDEFEILKPSRTFRKTLGHLSNFFFFLDGHEKIAARMIELVREPALSAQVRTSRDLTEIIEDARYILASQGKQLVLMFEDIANNGVGLSNSVYDLFRTSGTSGEGYANSDGVFESIQSSGIQLKPVPLRVIFAATTGYWQGIPQNVRNTCRRFDVNTLSMGNEASEKIGRQIISKYFNVARLGKSAISSAWENANESERRSGKWIPNKCDDCLFKKECHEEFGHVDGFGLYPLNEKATHMVLNYLQKVNFQEGHIGFSLRDIVKRLVSEWLSESHATMSTGKFPNARVEEIVGNEASISLLLNNRTAFVSDRESEDFSKEMLERVYRTRVVWADYINSPNRESYSPVIARAFGLPEESSSGIEAATTEIIVIPPLPPSTIGKEEWFHNEYLDVTLWASGSVLSPGRVKVLREFLVKLVEQSLRLDRYLISDRRIAIRNIVDEYLGLTSIRIEGGVGDEPDNRRIQKAILRSPESRALLHAAFWLKETGGWASEYVKDGLKLKCLPDVLFRGRYLLNQWVDSLSSQIVNKIRESIDEAVETIQLTQLRLLSLNDPDFLDYSNIVAIQKLTGTDFQLGGQFAPAGAEIIDELIKSFDDVMSSAITARQGAGATRLAEDVITKLRVFDEFTRNPNWRDGIEIGSGNQLHALRESLKEFSELMLNELSHGEQSINDFRSKLKNLDLRLFESDLIEYSQVFETLISRNHVNLQIQPQIVRGLIGRLQSGVADFIMEKDSLENLIDSSLEMTDPEIWCLLKRFPTLNEWTQSYMQVLAIAEQIQEDLAESIKGKAVPDVKLLREDIEKCLAGVSVAFGGEENDA